MKKRILLLLTVVMLNGLLQAQVKAGNKNYDRLAYKKAAANYERSLRKDSADALTWSKMGDCYRLLRESKNAERSYAHAVKGEGTASINHLYYAEALMQNEKYSEAKIQLEKYKALAPSDSRSENLSSGIDNLSNILATSGVYKIKPTNLNSKESDFSPVVYNGGVVFTSNRKNVEWIDNSHSWTGKQFYRLYYAKGNDASFSSLTPFADKMQTKYHDGPVCFNATGSQMIFTRNNIESGEIKKDDMDVVRLKLFTSNWSDGNWGIEIPFAYNSDKYSCAHPSLSADGKTLIFSSDMPGGQGGMDLYKSEWNGTSWGSPINLGPETNTAGNEVFPTLTSDGILMFSSDGLAGIGGLDLFQTEMKSGNWSKPENMGAPLNSSFDDFGITYNPLSKNGYFTSNRKNESFNDDIYFFEKQCTNTDVVILDEETGAPLADAVVKVFENGTEISSVTTDETGKFNKCLNPSKSYEFVAIKDAYTENKSSLSNMQLSEAASTGTQVMVPLKKKPIIVNIANLSGRVYNQDDNTPEANQRVALTNKTTGAELITMTDNNGNYSFQNIPLNNDFVVSTSKKNCGEAKEVFHTHSITGTKNITQNLPLLCKGDVIRIDNIYYDYNKSDIRPDAAIELDKVITLLNKYPDMKIELRSHTDARGKDEYNTKLSDSRAKSAVAYIESKGIAKTRLVAKGYGESQLLNKCTNGVECDDKMHEENRRTEFKILSL